MKSLRSLRTAAERLPGERKVAYTLDKRARYQQEFPAEFPFEIRRIFYSSSQPTQPLWHTHLEIFVLLSSECRRQMGDTIFHLARGDVLVTDHLKLHRVVDFPGTEAEAIVIRFLPEIARSAAPAPQDHSLLLPFYCHVEEHPNLLRAGDPDAIAVHATLGKLIECYATPGHADYRQSSARAYFILLLHHLARHFQAAERLKPLFAGQQARVGRLSKVFAHINEHYASPISLPEMVSMAGLSRQRFNTVFKNSAGMTLVDYITQVRLTNATRLLRETDHTISQIAAAMGFSDQSYFDRRFRRHFGCTPLQFRRGTPRQART